MYCRKCGAEIADDAKFCYKCGQEIEASSSSQSVKSNITSKNTTRNKLLIPIVSIILLVAVILIARGLITKKNSNSKNFSLDKISKQCDGCNSAIECYLELIRLGNDFRFDEDEVNAWSLQKYYDMQHNCTAEVINVENIPYVYRGCLGSYTGEWKGAGPSGTGTFIGGTHFDNEIVSYKGEWAYGLPEGEGELFIQDLNYSQWDMSYYGQMVAGVRHGTGNIYEYYNQTEGSNRNDKYRIYNQTTFQNDNIAVDTDCAEYDATNGELLRYYRMIGDGKGWVNLITSWGPDELNPDDKAALEFGASVLTVSLFAYAVGKTISPGGYDHEAANKQMMDELNSYNAQKEADEQAALEAQQQQQEKDRNFHYNQYQKALSTDKDEYLIDTKFHKYNAGLGY